VNKLFHDNKEYLKKINIDLHFYTIFHFLFLFRRIRQLLEKP